MRLINRFHGHKSNVVEKTNRILDTTEIHEYLEEFQNGVVYISFDLCIIHLFIYLTFKR